MLHGLMCICGGVVEAGLVVGVLAAGAVAVKWGRQTYRKVCEICGRIHLR
jgi:hypothetical protein